MVLARALNSDVARRPSDGRVFSEQSRPAPERLCEADKIEVVAFSGAEPERQLGRARYGFIPSVKVVAGEATPRSRSARYNQLIKASRRRGVPKEDAKDIVQEAHLRLFEYQRRTVIRDVDSLLRRIVINLSINFYHRELEDPAMYECIDRADRYGDLVDQRSGLDEALISERGLEALANMLGAISERTCQIFLMQRVGYNYKEIASAFAIKPRTVEKHVKRAVSEVIERQIRACEPSPIESG